MHYGNDRHWVSGDRGVSEWTITGTDTSGKRHDVQGCDLFKFRGGMIARKDSYWKIVA
ncbi:MAG: nuclear transport factor 2 family protein [Actinomycetota bacterium]|nr:nuclear transport factor 2 family protein [Actinomycetota bacterium]